VPGSAKAESPEVLKERQAKEWKEMKAKVALLKKERQNLPKKGHKDRKAAAAQEIRQLQEDMQVRHVAELRAAGLDAPAASTVKSRRGAASAADAMSDV